MSVCLSIEPWLVFTNSHPASVIIQSCYLYHACMYATDTAQVMTPAHTGTACNYPMQVHMYYIQDLSFLPQSSLRRGTTARHAVPKSLAALLRLASSLSFIPALLVVVVVVRRNLHKLVRFVFWASWMGRGSSAMRISNDTATCIIKPIVRDRVVVAAGRHHTCRLATKIPPIVQPVWQEYACKGWMFKVTSCDAWALLL